MWHESLGPVVLHDMLCSGAIWWLAAMPTFLNLFVHYYYVCQYPGICFILVMTDLPSWKSRLWKGTAYMLTVRQSCNSWNWWMVFDQWLVRCSSLPLAFTKTWKAYLKAEKGMLHSQLLLLLLEKIKKVSLCFSCRLQLYKAMIEKQQVQCQLLEWHSSAHSLKHS